MKFFCSKKNLIDLFFYLNFCIIIPYIYVVYIDPTLLNFSDGKTEILYPETVCYDLPRCLRILSLNINYFFNYIFIKILIFLEMEVLTNFGYFFISFISLGFITLSINRIISNNFISIFCLYYVLITLIYYKVPLLRIYDYLVLVYIFFILRNVNLLSKNFFSFFNIFLLLIGSLIFEYASFLYFGSIILFNFIENLFKKKLFQSKHLFLLLIPILTLLLMFFLITTNDNYYYVFKGNQNYEVLYLEYGQHNHKNLVLTYLINYSESLIFTLLFFLLLVVCKKQKFFDIFSIFKNKFINLNFCIIVVFLLAICAGMLISGYQSEWKRQFIPLLFLTTTLSGLLLERFKNNPFDKAKTLIKKSL